MILELINRELSELGINYSLMEATNPTLPYFTGEIYETDWTFEDNQTKGEILLEGWTRNSWAELFAAKDKIKKHFADYQIVENNEAFFIAYLNCSPIRTGEAEWKKIQIRLEYRTWIVD